MNKKDDQAKPSQRSSRLLSRISPPVLGLLIVLVVGGISLAVWNWSKNSNGKQELISVEVHRGDIEDLVAAIGTLQPRDYVDVGAQVSGQLKKIFVEVGQAVKEGDLLAEIDAEQSAARVEASLAQMRSLEAQLEQRHLNLTKVERDLVRFRNLVAEEAATVESLQNAQTSVAVEKAQIAQLRAQIDQLKASTRVEQANLKYTKIYAPMSGTVVSIVAKQGQTLNANQSAPNLMRIADLSVMSVQTQVSEADVSKLRAGMETYFTTLGGQGTRWYGRLTKIEPTPTVTNNVVLYNALFEVPNESGSLMTQMTAQVFFIVAQVRDVLFLPMSAITQVGSGAAQQNGAELQARREPDGSAASARTGRSGEGSAARSDETQASSSMSDEKRENQRTERRATTGGRGENAVAPAGTQRRSRSAVPRQSTEASQREAWVKVIRPDGSIEERKVTIGVSNRVHIEVISGLETGEKVVVGVREQEKQRAEGQAGRQPSSPMQTPVPGMGRR